MLSSLSRVLLSRLRACWISCRTLSCTIGWVASMNKMRDRAEEVVSWAPKMRTLRRNNRLARNVHFHHGVAHVICPISSSSLSCSSAVEPLFFPTVDFDLLKLTDHNENYESLTQNTDDVLWVVSLLVRVLWPRERVLLVPQYILCGIIHYIGHHLDFLHSRVRRYINKFATKRWRADARDKRSKLPD